MQKTDLEGIKIFSTENLDFKGNSVSDSMLDRKQFNFIESFNKRASKTTIIKYGVNNDHPKFLKELVSLSSMHRGLVETKANLTMGDDIFFVAKKEGESERAYKFVDDLGLVDKREALSLDLSTFGGIMCQLAYKEDIGNGNPRVLKMAYKHDFDEFRLLNPQENDFGIYEPSYGAIHPCWGRNYRANQAMYLPLWFDHNTNPDFELDKEIYGEQDDAKIAKYQNRFFYYDRIYTNLTKYYPMPDYQTRAGINAIILDGELIEFSVNELRNGLSVGHIVTFIRKDWSKEDPEKERKTREAERDIVRDSMTGSRNNKRVTIVRVEPTADSEGKAIKPMDISEIPNTNTAQKNTVLENRKNSYILVAHGIIAPEIAGIPDGGSSSFSSDADRIVDAIANLFFIRLNKQREVLKRFYYNVAKEGGFDIEDVKFIDNIPFRKKIDAAILKHAFLIDEIREMSGYSKLTDEEKAQLENEKNPVLDTSGTQTELNLK